MMVRRSVYFSPNSFSKAANYSDMIDMQMLPAPAGFYDEGLRSLDDWDFAIRASLKGWKVKAIPELLHQARVHQGRVTGHVNESELYAKYPYMKGYIFLSRVFDVGVLLITKPNFFARRFYNKVVCRLLHTLPQPEPPTSFQHEWVNEKSLLRKVLQTSPSTILDCGCGVGRWGYLLRGKHMVGIDRHKPYLLKAKRYEEVVCASASCLPFQPLSFHVGLGVELIEHLPKEEGFMFLHDIKRVCRHIVLTTPKNFEPIYFGDDHPETHKSHWSKSELLGALKLANSE